MIQEVKSLKSSIQKQPYQKCIKLMKEFIFKNMNDPAYCWFFLCWPHSNWFQPLYMYMYILHVCHVHVFPGIMTNIEMMTCTVNEVIVVLIRQGHCQIRGNHRKYIDSKLSVSSELLFAIMISCVFPKTVIHCSSITKNTTKKTHELESHACLKNQVHTFKESQLTEKWLIFIPHL